MKLKLTASMAATLVAAIIYSIPAEAAHCRKGQIYRVSMHKCVAASSRLGREIKHGRRYAVRVERRKPRREKPGWYADILLPDDGSIKLGDEKGKTPEPKALETRTPPTPAGTPPNPYWPPGWENWYSPRHLQGP